MKFWGENLHFENIKFELIRKRDDLHVVQCGTQRVIRERGVGGGEELHPSTEWRGDKNHTITPHKQHRHSSFRCLLVKESVSV